WKRSTKDGDVTTFMDKTLKGTVYRISGAVPASNYLQLPKTGTQSLGLTGRYIYILFKPAPGKYFVVHLDVATEDSQVVRISFSNLFKEFKSTATWLQFPYICGAAHLVGLAPSNVRWTCLILDLRHVLGLYLNRTYSHLKSVKLCSNLLVKNLFTSDLLFDPALTSSEAHHSKMALHGFSPMPREMAFPAPCPEVFLPCFSSLFPAGRPKDEPVTQIPKDVSLSKPVRDRVSLIQQITSPKEVGELCSFLTPRAVQEVLTTIPLVTDGTEKKDLWPFFQAYDHWTHEIVRHLCAIWVSQQPQGLRRGPSVMKVVMFSSSFFTQALWASGSSVVVYPCHALIVAITIDSGKQRFFAGHTDKVAALAFNNKSTLLASTQMGEMSVVRLWDFPSGKCLCVFKTGIHSISCLSFSYSGNVLCGTGKDKRGKTVVVVWNTIQVSRGGEVVMLAKAHTDVDIRAFKIAFFDDTRMVSCGRDNVRLWRIQSGALRSCPVNLGEHRSLEFTDLAFEVGHSTQREPEDRTLFVCSRSGHVLEIDYKNVTVKNVRRLLPVETGAAPQREKQGFNSGPGISLNSICLSSSFCATASDDGYLRLWPLDFSEVFLEAEHNNPVSSVRISPDNLKVLCTTATGNVGCLDIQSRNYCTIMRSHVGTVLAFSVDSSQKQLATVSEDNTIRIWNVESMQQLYEFTASDEVPCTVAFHPLQPIFACGFNTGVVRTISLAASRLLEEHKQHRGLITGLTFSPDGHFMYSSCTHGTLSLYNCAVQKSHTVRVLANVVSQDTDHGPDALSVSCDGRLLAFVGPSKYIITLMDAHTLDELLRIDVSILDLDSTALDVALRLCFAPFPLGPLLVSTSSQKILVLDAKSGRLIRMVPQVHRQSCSSLTLSPDGRYVLTAGDRTIKVWDYEMRFDVCCQVFIGHSEPIQQVRFTADQKQVFSVGDAIFLWDFLGVFPNPPSHVASCLFTDPNLENVQNSPPGSSDAPRQLVPLPTVVSPPCLDLSALHRLVEQGEQREFITIGTNQLFSIQFYRQLNAPPGCLITCLSRDLKAVIGYNGNARGNMVWNPDTGFFAYSCGCVLIVEDLHSGSQQHWLGHPEEISTLALSHNAQVLASASAQGGGDRRCQICIWNVQNRTCEKILFHHENQVQAMAYSQDDRFLVTLGDYVDRVVALWNSQTYDLVSSTRLAEPVHDLAFNPLSVGQLACVGKGAVTFWLMKQQGSDINLKVQRVPAPDALGGVELTSMCYSSGCLLYTGTSTGQICSWDTETNCCFMTWEAVDGEIGVLQCRHNRLVSGSNAKKIQIWSVAAVQELRVKGSDARSNSVLLEQEITLDGTIVSAAFDDGMDMGIVGTTAGTLWYINWTENTSIRLISGHKNKVSEVAFSPGESHFATCAEDGSVRVWSLASLELVVQFQVLNQSCLCLAWSPVPTSINGLESHHIVAGYSDGTIRLFSISRTEMELKMHPHSVAVRALGYSADGREQTTMLSWPTGMTIRVLTDHRPSPLTLSSYTELGTEGSDLWLASSSDRRVSVWISDWLKDKCEIIDWLSFPAPQTDPTPQGHHPGNPLPPSLAAFCPWDKSTIAYVGFGLQKEILFYSLQQKQVIEKIPLPSFFRLASSPFLCHAERMLRLIDCATKTSEDYAGYNDTVCLCRFAPSGKRLFTASYNEILVWEVQSR
uniref:WD repeat domain 90 n=1 Tax=Naja naja TaxID=35670 RepID=A0A8C6VNU7_NAJNA